MGSNKRLRRRVAPFVDPNERIDAVFPAQTGLSPWWFSLAAGLMGGIGAAFSVYGEWWWWVAPLIGGVAAGTLQAFATTNWILVTTDRRLLVLAAGRWRRMKPVRLDAELHRQKFGRRSGLWTPIRVSDRVMRVHFWYAGALADVDEVLTREGDHSIPEPVPTPGTARQIAVGSLAVAIAVGVIALVTWVAGGDDEHREPNLPVGPVRLLASGTFPSGHGWRVYVFRNANGRACSRAELVGRPPSPTSDPMFSQPMADESSKPAGGSCDSHFPDQLSGVGGGEHRRAHAGIVSKRIVRFEVRPCAGARRSLSPLSALGEKWIAFGVSEPTREIVGLDADGDVVDRYVFEEFALEVDGEIVAEPLTSREPRERAKVLQLSPCDHRWSGRNR